MKKAATILVTGSSGYIGSLLVDLLKKAGYRVVGLDTGYFDNPACQFKAGEQPNKFIKKDIRQIEKSDLENIDAICHLAAISNDPMGALNPELTYEINLRASEKLAKLAKEAGVKKFLFSSSCSVYGQAGNKDITEEDAVDPKTAYAVSKVEFEKILLKLADTEFCPIILRNSTAYGSSPKLRLDLVLNNLTANAFTSGKIKILSDGSPWRPMIHAEDIARLFVALLDAPRAMVCAQIINAGRNEENFRVKEIAEVVRKSVPQSQLSFSSTPDKDSRTYRVNFDKLKRLLPDFKFKWTLEAATKELLSDFKIQGLPKEVIEAKKFVRLTQLNQLIGEGKIDSELHWKK